MGSSSCCPLVAPGASHTGTSPSSFPLTPSSHPRFSRDRKAVGRKAHA